MRNYLQTATRFIVLCGLLLITVACSPEAKKSSRLQSADRFFDTGEYSSAEVEYRNVLKIEPLNPKAMARLGIIYVEQGRLGLAFTYLKKGNELQPDNLDLRIKLAQLALITGNLKGAQEHAGFVLERRPTDPDAPQLLVSSVTKVEDFPSLRNRLLNLPSPAPNGAPVLSALGTLALRQSNLREAEILLRQALTIDPKFAPAESALGSFYLAEKNSAQAAQSFKRAAELSPPRSSRRLQYAQFLLQSGDVKGGKQQLAEIIQKVPDYVPAWIALAEIALIEKDFVASRTSIEKALARDPGNLEASLLDGRLLFAREEFPQAIAAFEKLTAAYPKLPVVHLYLSGTYATMGDLDKAIDQANQALELAPGNTDTALQLAGLQIKKRDFRGAVVLLKKLVQQRPDLIQARLFLAESYRALGDLDAALATYRQIEELSPRNPEILLLLGNVLIQKKNPAEARKAFVKASELAPDSLAVLEQLTGLDVIEKNYSSARQRVEAQIAKDPKIAGPYLLQARISLAEGETSQAEASLNKVVDLQPDSPAAYLLLARLYNNSRQQEKALANFQLVLAKNPKNTEALMMTAAIQNQQKNFAAARETYEKLLALNPKFIPALNNLAFLYSEQFNQPDKAQALAQKALELLPHEPHAADTLGWILFKKREYTRALTQLEESADKIPGDAEIQFHLGMTHYMLGGDDAARSAFECALRLDKDFSGKEVIRDRLSILAIKPGTSGARESLEKTLVDRPDDPVVLARLAAIYTQDGTVEKAITAYQSALKASPKNIAAMLELSRLYNAHQEAPKALELAKAARKLAPDDPDVILALGRLAYQSGDHPWAVSLLQETVTKKPDDPEVLFELAQAMYSVGRVDDAQSFMKRFAQTEMNSPQKDQARLFLEFTDASRTPNAAKIEQVLASNSSYVPALMASAAVIEGTNSPGTSRQIYEKVLVQFPNFTPAMKRLAILSADEGANDQKALDLALKARGSFPDDPEIAKAAGIILYLRKDYTRAANLLREASAKTPNDALLMYYLGMSQYQLKKPSDSKQSLQRALDLKLRADRAAEAKQTIASLK